jgi:hypothetical protein
MKRPNLLLLFAFFPILAFLGLAVSGCGFIDLRPLGFETYPALENAVLPLGDTPVRVAFDSDMEYLETQEAFSVIYPGGTVNGDVRWEGNELLFVPPEGWRSGVRYTLALAGTVYARDGRELRTAHYVPFYAVSAEEGPLVISSFPEEGTSIGTGTEEKLRIVFSMPMDRLSTADALSVDGLSERELLWFDDDTVVELYPKKSLHPWTVYHWSLSTKAKSRGGTALVKAVEGMFVTDGDRLLPKVTELCPLLEADPYVTERWLRTGLDLEDGLGPGQAIGVVFNKSMDDSVLNCLRFEPNLSGRTERWTGSSIVFIPDKDPEPERIYTLVISGEAKDYSGLTMEREYRSFFTPDIPYLTLLYHEEGKLSMPDKILKIRLRFSLPFSSQARIDTLLALRFEPYFPGTLNPVSLRSARWWSEDLLDLEFDGIEPGTEEPHYYRLRIPGGREGITNGRGSYLKETLSIFIEGVME